MPLDEHVERLGSATPRHLVRHHHDLRLAVDVDVRHEVEGRRARDLGADVAYRHAPLQLAGVLEGLIAAPAGDPDLGLTVVVQIGHQGEGSRAVGGVETCRARGAASV